MGFSATISCGQQSSLEKKRNLKIVKLCPKRLVKNFPLTTGWSVAIIHK